MQIPKQRALRKQNVVRRFLNWLCSWRGVRRILIVLAWTAAIIALLYAEENWRGWRVWETYRKELEARGEQFDLKLFIPQPIPDDQNFAATPIAASWFENAKVGEGPNKWEDPYAQLHYKVPSRTWGRTNQNFIDLDGWAMAFEPLKAGRTNDDRQLKRGKLGSDSRARAAPSVLELLKPNKAMFSELQAASSRPLSRYPIKYDLDNPGGILLPHLNQLKEVILRLRLKACAELALGQNNAALEDVKLMLRLTDSVKNEPFLVCYVVRVACLQLAIQPVWEGLAEHRWSDAQLQEFQTRFREYDLLVDLQKVVRSERAAGVLTADLLYHRNYRLNVLFNRSDVRLPDLLARLAPRGWYQLEQVNYCRFYQKQWEEVFDSENQRIFPEQAKRASNAKEEIYTNSLFQAALRHRVLAVLLVPRLDGLWAKGAAGQTAADQVVLACALERYRLMNGRFPESLNNLVPTFVAQLPHDLITGEPYKYRRDENGQFVLYSIGWNAQDDGGTPGKTYPHFTDGDWVWRSSP